MLNRSVRVNVQRKRPRPPADDWNASLPSVVAAAIEASSKDRDQVALELTQALGRRITKSQLNDWTSDSKRAAHFPADAVEAFCLVVKDDRLQRRIMGHRLRRLTAYAERHLAALRDERQRQEILSELLREEGEG